MISKFACVLWSRTHSQFVVGKAVGVCPLRLDALAEDMQPLNHEGKYDNGCSRLEA